MEKPKRTFENQKHYFQDYINEFFYGKNLNLVDEKLVRNGPLPTIEQRFENREGVMSEESREAIKDLPDFVEQLDGIIHKLNDTNDVREYKELVNEFMVLVDREPYYKIEPEIPTVDTSTFLI